MARRRKKGSRKKRWPSIASIGVGLNGAYQFGLLDAGAQLLAGNVQGAINAVANKNNTPQKVTANVINTAVPAAIVSMARKFGVRAQMGSIRII